MAWDMTDAEFAALLERDPIAALGYAVQASGGTMTLHGVPIETDQLRIAAHRHAVARLDSIVAPPLREGVHIEEHW